MQWLVDLVIEAIGIPPVFIDRGDPAVADFAVGDLTADGAWHNLDLSGIVPANASAVLLHAGIRDNLIGQNTYIRRKGNVNWENSCRMITQVANLAISQDIVCPIGSNGLLEYNLSATVWTSIGIRVKGWWL